MGLTDQTPSPTKRTSHYYKKKLQKNQDELLSYKTASKITAKIEKKPKEPKLRAKEARERKKFYIQKLEERIAQLQRELKTQKEKSSVIQSTNSAFINLNKVEKPTETYLEVKPMLKKAETAEYTQEVIKLAGIQNAFRRLYGAVQMRSQQEAEKTIEVLRQRFGVAGQQRIKWFEELLLKMVSIMMPMHCRLLLQNCQNRQEFYKLIGCGQSMKEERKLYFDKDTIVTLCESRPAIVEIKQQYKKILSKMTELSEKMIHEAKRLQQQIDKIENSMSSLFVAKILVDLDMERKKTENLNQIFPVNYYKEELYRAKHLPEPIKAEEENIGYRQFQEDEIIERLSGFSDEEHYLLSMLSE